MERKIIHVDMDAYFASVEQRDNPELKGKPVVVGGDSKRSVVAAASYEARNFGIYSAMPMAMAKQRCKDLVIVPHRFGRYKEVSNQIREIFGKYTDLVEPLSLDEAYLDVTKNKLEIPSATIIAQEIKNEILKVTMLTCTAGISINKFLAKIASDMNKPDGLTVIAPNQVTDFITQLSIEKFFGVGPVTTKKMKSLGIHTGGDLQKVDQRTLIKHFGKAGRYYYNVCRGIDERKVTPSRERKSISVERTFEEDIITREEAVLVLKKLSDSLSKSLFRLQVKGKTIHLKYRYPDFTTLTRSKTLATYLDDPNKILAVALELFDLHRDPDRGLRLLGLGLSNLEPRNARNLQLTFSW